MSKAIFRLPSNKVQYGYVEIEVDLDTPDGELPDPFNLGAMYVEYMAKYVEGELSGLKTAQRELSDSEVKTLLKEELGATELSPEEAAKPWNNAVEPETKPWESAPPSADDWDF